MTATNTATKSSVIGIANRMALAGSRMKKPYLRMIAGAMRRMLYAQHCTKAESRDHPCLLQGGQDQRDEH